MTESITKPQGAARDSGATTAVANAGGTSALKVPNQNNLASDSERKQQSSRWKLFAVIAVCASPVIASYLTFYVIKPTGRTNYGDFITSDVRSLPTDIASTTLDGQPMPLKNLEGKWIMLHVDNGACNELCKSKLYDMRQLRLTQGRERDRIERVWLITDDAPIDTVLMREYDGTRMLRANAAAVAKWLPTATGTASTDHLYMIDPVGRLMMRFPKDANASKIKKDIGKLLAASKIG